MAGSAPYCPGPVDVDAGPQLESLVDVTLGDGSLLRIDATEITLGQYQGFANALAGASVAVDGCGDVTPIAAPEPVCSPDAPVLALWCEAKAYCSWKGLSLCSAPAWEHTCTNAGTTYYPYGNLLDSRCAGTGYQEGSTCHGIGDPFESIYNMSGSYAEWVDLCEPGNGDPSSELCQVRGGGKWYGNPGEQGFFDAQESTDCFADSPSLNGWQTFDMRAAIRCCDMPDCSPGSTESCYEGPVGTLGKGICSSGTHTCLPDGTGYGACTGQALPSAESCATAWDDDCNGVENDIGDDCDCAPGTTRDCYGGLPSTLDVSICHAGQQTCTDAGHGYGPCEGEVAPSQELCGGGDEDCDGLTNEEGCPCVAGSQIACYSGDETTRDIGRCRSGIKTCAPDGTGYGPCTGEIVPQPEICGTGLDEDCNGFADERGVSQPCTGGLVFAKGFGSAGATLLHRLVVDAQGNALVFGQFYGTVSFAGAFPLSTNSFYTGFVGKLDRHGQPLASHEIHPEPQFSSVLDASMAGAGFVALVQVSGGLEGTSLVKLDSNLTELWTAHVSGGFPQSVAGTPDGGAAALVLETDGYSVSRYKSDGTLQWKKSLHTTIPFDSSELVPRVASRPDGTILVFMTVRHDVEVDGTVVTTNKEAVDACLLKIAPDGSSFLATCFGDHRPQRASWISVDAAGNMILLGQAEGSIDLGLGPLVAPDEGGQFIARFAPDGTPTWNKMYPGNTIVAVDGKPGAGLVIAKSVPLSPYHELSQLDDAGNVRKTVLYTTSGAEPIEWAMLDGQGGFYIAGHYIASYPIDLGQGPIPNPIVQQGLLARFLLP